MYKRQLLAGEEEVELKPTGEEGILLIKALCGLDRMVSNVNIPNTNLQIPNLPADAVVETNAVFEMCIRDRCDIMEKALDVGIVTMGGGGDFPRNVMCSPLSGVEKEEYFDVRPWAEAAGELSLIHI